MPTSLMLEEDRRNLLHEEDSRRRRAPELALLAALRPGFEAAALLYFLPAFLLTSSTSPSDSEPRADLYLSWVTGTAPYEPVPGAGELRVSKGLFDMMNAAMHPTKELFRGWTSR